MLDRLNKAFDPLTSKHNLFKVENIGDSYRPKMLCASTILEC